MNARITILHDVVTEAAEHQAGAGSEPATDAFDAEILALKQPIMQLMAHQPVARGAAVRIDTSDALWLGETEECLASGGGFSIRVRLRHVLRDFDTLARLAERFGSSAATGALNDAPKGTPVEI